MREPRGDFADFVEPIAIALEQERKVTDQISELAAIAREERDFVSEQFVQWFLKEQVEEIDLMSTLLTTAERARQRPLDIEEFIAREGIGGDEDVGLLRAARPPVADLELHALAPGAPDGRRDGRPRGGLPLRGASARSTSRSTTCACPAPAGDLVADTLRDAAARGVAVRIAYNADHDERMIPPPPSTAPELIEALPFPTAGIPGIPDLMHHKYVVRDGEAVWTGSTNWTTDSWTLQENLVTVARSRRARGRVHRQLRGAVERRAT